MIHSSTQRRPTASAGGGGGAQGLCPLWETSAQHLEATEMFLGYAPGGEPALNLSGSPPPSFCPFVAPPSSHCCLVFFIQVLGF